MKNENQLEPKVGSDLNHHGNAKQVRKISEDGLGGKKKASQAFFWRFE